MRNLSTTILMMTIPAALLAQAPPPLMPPDQLDQLVSRIALYPDPLLAQILAASTYPDQIADADMWANQHKYLHGDDLARAINEDHVPWDPSVQALLPFPDVLHMMAIDPTWTRQLGDQFLAQHDAVMDAVQVMRHSAYQYGYLRSNPHFAVVVSGPSIIINPLGAGLYYVPIYNPAVVFIAPRPGFVVGGAITFGIGISIGAAFAPWGWGTVRFGWATHEVIINNHPWARTFVNRGTYVHPYTVPRYAPARRVEGHRLEEHRHEGPR
jgi:Protein of unknown function (DUF3300)